MAGLIGSVLAEGALGAAEGLGVGAAKVGAQWTAEMHARARDEALALRAESLARIQAQEARKTHAVNVDTDLAAAPRRADLEVATALRKPRTLAPGSSEVVGGEITVTAPEKPQPKELLEYYKANAARLNAEARAIEEDRKYRRGAGEKPQLPSIKVERLKGPDGEDQIVNVDQNSGAIGTIIPGEAAKPGKSRWFSPDEPGTPATQPRIQWTYNGKVLTNGLADLYPAIKERSGAPTGASTGSSEAAARQMALGPPQSAVDALRKEPMLAAQFDSKYGKGAADRVLSSAAPRAAQPALTETPESGAGPAYDAARAARQKANDELLFQSGFRRRNADPAGLQAAKERSLQAQRDSEAALKAWEAEHDAFARPSTRVLKP